MTILQRGSDVNQFGFNHKKQFLNEWIWSSGFPAGWFITDSEGIKLGEL